MFYLISFFVIIFQLEIIRKVENYINAMGWIKIPFKTMSEHLTIDQISYIWKINIAEILFCIWMLIGVFSNQSGIFIILSITYAIIDFSNLKSNELIIKIRAILTIFAVLFLTLNEFKLHYKLNIWQTVF